MWFVLASEQTLSNSLLLKKLLLLFNYLINYYLLNFTLFEIISILRLSSDFFFHLQRSFIRQVMNGGGANAPTSNIDIHIGDPICTPDLIAIKHARPVNFT